MTDGHSVKSVAGMRGGWTAVAIFALCLIVSFVDRMVLGLLVDPLKAAFAVSDVQIGLLIGAAFAIVYTLTGLPLGMLADRANRRNLIVLGLIVWSALTITSGLVASFLLLLLCRCGVALGEAALSPAATSLIADRFPPERRALPVSVYFASGMVGAAGAYIIGSLVLAAATKLSGTGGGLLALEPWRLTLIAVGLPGLLLAALVAVVVREPARTGADVSRPPGAGRRHLRDLFLGPWRGFGALFLAAAFGQLAPSALGAWVPSLLAREYGLSPVQAGLALGATALLACPAGQIILSAVAARLWRRQHRLDGVATLCAVSSLAGLLLFLVVPFVVGVLPLLLTLGAAMFFVTGVAAVPPVAVSLALPNQMRGIAVAASLFAISMIGFALGPVLVPLLARDVFAGPRALTLAIGAAGAASGVFALGFALLGRAFFARSGAVAAADDVRAVGDRA